MRGGRHLSDRTLADLAGEARSAGSWIMRHLGGCTTCRSELALRRALHQVHDSTPTSCPEPERLLLLSEGVLDASPEREQLESHILGCSMCAITAEDLWQLGPRFRGAKRRTATATAVAGKLGRQLRQLVSFEMPAPLALTPRGGGRKAGAKIFGSAMAAYRAERYGDARELLAQALEAGESAPGLAFYLGVCALHQGDVDAAVAGLERAVRIEPGLGEYNWYLAQALLQSGRGDEALVQLRRAARKPGRYRADARRKAAELAQYLA